MARARSVRSFRVHTRRYFLICAGCGQETEYSGASPITGHPIDIGLEDAKRFAREDGFIHIPGEGWYCANCWAREQAEMEERGKQAHEENHGDRSRGSSHVS